MAAVATLETNRYPAFQMDEQELIGVLRNSLYPGAKDDSIKMVVGYCRASNLDPMQKPVHIVPIYDSKAKEMRDVVMPGIGLYRSQASRSGQYAGVSEAEFGDDITEDFPAESYYDKYDKTNKERPGVKLTYPKWCRVTVKRLLPNGAIVEFTAKELWKENYATVSRDSKHPNAMWTRRPYAQLAECAEAQALRKAFPEFGAQPTADEMEGKEIDITPDVQPASTSAKTETPYLNSATFAAIAEKYRPSVASGKKSVGEFIAWVENKGSLLTDDQKMEVASWVKKEPATVEGQATEVDDDFVADMKKAEGNQ